MTQQKVNFIIKFSFVLATLILVAFFVLLCYQFIVLSNLRNEKISAQNGLSEVILEQEKKQEELDYLQNNYNQYLDDTAKDSLKLVKDNQTVIYGE